MSIRPIDIARKLNISTSALRHYGEWGIVPAPERAANGYRLYTEEHLAYFECIRAMNAGFGMQVTKDVMMKIQNKETEDAFWLVNEQQARLHHNKMIAEKTVQILGSIELDDANAKHRRKWMTIGEVSKETQIPSTTIRHWEKMGLLDVSRDNDNGYRKFNRSHVRKVLIIGTLRAAVYSLEVIKQVIEELDGHNVEQARQIARDSLKYLNYLNQARIKGIHTLYRLCNVLKLID